MMEKSLGQKNVRKNVRASFARRNNGQTSIEFVILASFMMLAFLVFYIVIQQKMVEANRTRTDQLAKEVQNIVVNELKLAESVSNGYFRRFYLPETINGMQYNISVITGVGGTVEIVTRFSNREIVYFIEQTYVDDVSTVDKGYNNITKNGGIILLSSE